MLKKINSRNFRRYGRLIEYPNKESKGKKRNLFRIVLAETKNLGWRIAYLVVREKTIRRLEQHPHSFESFEPLKGKCFLYVADRQQKERIERFLLDRPVILKKGIWHGLVTLDPETEIKLTENAQVQCHYWRLGFKLNSKE